MTYLRHSSRHVLHTVANYLIQHLTDLNWLDQAATPFGAVALQIQVHPSTPTEEPAGVQPGTVWITLGDEFDAEEQEIGGPLSLQELPIFVDIWMDLDGHALAVANDVRDILKGRFPGTARVLEVVDQSTGTSVDGWMVELTDVERVQPDSKLHWQVVKVTASTYFPEVVY